VPGSLKQSIKDEARRLGFTLVGVTTPAPPEHYPVFENWLHEDRHAQMHYLADDRSRVRRADPKEILPECLSIISLGIPYYPPPEPSTDKANPPLGQVAAYAQGSDYHLVLPERLQTMVSFIEAQTGHPIPNRYYTDTGPILERNLAMRAGLGWIGKNTCLINPRQGSYFFLAEILLGLELEPDAPFITDHCGNCTRCIDACPTKCILQNRTLDASRCISYLTIELKTDIPEDLRPQIGNWLFGCDVCQQVCPWNRFALPTGDQAFAPTISSPNLFEELQISPEQFNKKFKLSPFKRTKRRGYLRNIAVVLGNHASPSALPALQNALNHPEPLVREHARWSIQQITKHQEQE